MLHLRAALGVALLCPVASALSAAALLPGAGWPINKIRQEVWRTEEGLPQNTVPAIVQSSDGYLWAGTELGLVRFDGLHFTVFDKSNTPELKSNVVDALLQDTRGNLWIGTVGGGLTRLSGGQFHTFTTHDGLSNNSVSCLLEDPSGNIWIGTNGGGLNRLHQGHFSSWNTEQGLADNQVFALAYGAGGALWVGTHNGLNRLSNGHFLIYRTANGLPNNYVRALLMRSGALWIGTYGGGLARFQDGKFITFTTRNGLTSNSVVSLGEGPDKSLWIGTYGGGMTRLFGTAFSSYTTQNGLPNNDVWCIYHDRQNDLWIGTGGGGLVRLFNRSAIVSYDKKDGLSNNVTLPIFEDREGNIWIGTNGGGLNRFRDGKFSHFTTKNGLADDLVFSICEAPDGALWIGTRKGLNRFKDGRFETFTQKDGLPSDVVIVVYADSEGAIWIGTRAGLSRWKDRRFTTFTTKEGLSNDVVQALHEDRHHRLWIGTGGGGLDLFENGRFQVFDRQRGLSNDVVLAIHEDNQGTLWIGTDGGGLDRLKDGHLLSFTTKDGLLNDAIFRILQDDRSNLWMSSNKGLFRASLHALNEFGQKKIARVPVVSYGESDGMNTPECNGGFQPAGWKTRDGRLWFPTMKGVVAADPHGLITVPRQQLTVIEEVIANEQKLPLRSGLRVPPGPGDLEFHFSAPNFHRARRIQFQYQLVGFDEGWVHAGTRRAAYYTNIPPGRYRFKVEATDEDGTWSSAEASFGLTLEPHFYQTLWFYTLFGFSIAGVALAIHLSRMRALQQRERILEQHVQQRTAELRNEIAERERAELDSLKAKEAAERASQVKSEFLANMSHEIRTPMNAILGMTQLALAGELAAQQREHLEVVRDSATSLLRVIDDILDFSKVEAGKLDLELVDFAVRDSLEAALKPFALRAQQKGIRLEFSVDPDVPSAVHSDPLRLRQIILNLVGNALKFTDEGSVTVHAGCGALNAPEVVLHFTVSDTGSGIPEEKLTSIFEAFSQADSSTTRRYGGTGLGLAICSRLVQLMGGAIWARSEVGQGSEFHFTIKATVAAGEPAPHPDAASTAHTASLAALARLGKSDFHVLIAEDNPANRLVARLTLEKFGIHIHEASDGLEALSVARESRLDLILMDCRMPVMDGYEATRQIRALPEPASAVPIIALTASAFKEDRIRAERAGMDDFLAKPFQDAELVQKCFSWMNVARPAAHAREVDRLTGYSPELLRDLMQIFLDTAPPVFHKLTSSIESGDWEAAKASAHWLQGGASRLIAPEFQEQLIHIERMCSANSPAVSDMEIKSLTASFHHACEIAGLWLLEHKVAK